MIPEFVFTFVYYFALVVAYLSQWCLDSIRKLELDRSACAYMDKRQMDELFSREFYICTVTRSSGANLRNKSFTY